MRKYRRSFGRFKVINDISMVIIAGTISLILFGGFYGVREGTIFAAMTIGLFVKLFMKLIRRNKNEELTMMGDVKKSAEKE